ncbi:MAG: hypothetical protein DRZ80_08025 [Thermoprotei archaeon]|nr:MAG: hypothetical protein DRZ80_08025 [Thermoprotei archaeon]
MEHRKIVKIGGSYYVSLPKEWVEAHNLSESAIVSLNAKRGMLEIVPLGGGKESEITSIFLDNFVVQRLVTAYLDGFEVIEIISNKSINPSIVEEIESTLKLLVGAEIVEESHNKIVVQCFLREEYDISSLVYRIDRITRTMYVEAVKAVSQNDRELAESVVSRDDKVDKLFFLIVRLIRSKLKKACSPAKDVLKLLDCRLVIRNLERIGDYSEEIAKLAFKLEDNYNPELIDFFDKLNQHVNKMSTIQHTIVKSFLEEDMAKAIRGERQISKIYSGLINLRNTALDKRLPQVIHLTVDRVMRIAEELADIAGLTAG